MFEIPFMCCNFTLLGMVAASKPHVLHFSLSVFPLNIFEVVYGQNILINQNFISKRSIFDRHKNAKTFISDGRLSALAFSEAA